MAELRLNHPPVLMEEMMCPLIALGNRLSLCIKLSRVGFAIGIRSI